MLGGGRKEPRLRCCQVTLGTSMHLTSVLLCPTQPEFVLKPEPDAASEISLRAENKLGKEGSMQGGSRAKKAACPRKA